MNNISLFILFAIALFALVDFLPRMLIAKKRRPVVAPSYTRTPRYVILPTVYGDISYLRNIAFLKKYASNVIICTSRYETPEFYSALRKACRKYGMRYTCADLPVVKGRPLKNPYTIYRGVLTSGQLRIPANTPCLLLDADTYAEGNVNNLVRAFKTSHFDIASLRCEVSDPKTVIEQLQAFEYKLAMDGRNMDPWLTSGACNIATARILKHVFSKHSNFFIGGDIEIGKLATIMGYKIGFLDFKFYTEAPDTINAWFKQRIIWFSGGVRHHLTNIGSFGWQHFFLLFYNSLLIYLLLPLRWLEFIQLPILFPIVIGISWLYVFILCLGKGWKPIYLLLPAYSFIQTMIILPLAVIRYFQLVRIHRSFGHLTHDLSRLRLNQKILYRSLNLASAVIVLVTAYIFTVDRIEYWHDYDILRTSTTSSIAQK